MANHVYMNAVVALHPTSLKTELVTMIADLAARNTLELHSHLMQPVLEEVLCIQRCESCSRLKHEDDFCDGEGKHDHWRCCAGDICNACCDDNIKNGCWAEFHYCVDV